MKDASRPNKSKRKSTEGSPKRLYVDSIPHVAQRDLLQVFARHLERYLSGVESGGRKEILADVVQELAERDELAAELRGLTKIDGRQFEPLLRAMFQHNYLRIAFEQDRDLSQKLNENPPFDQLQNVTVVAGSDPRRFAQAAAEVLIREIFRIGAIRRRGDSALNVGIISGTTTGSVIREAIQLNWKNDLGKDVSVLPKVNVFALNISLTTKGRLRNSATILTHQLSDKIISEGANSVAFGLSAPLMIPRDQLRETDLLPQTREVVLQTDPARVQDSPESLESSKTNLDVVLTGVGEPRGSIFYELAQEFGRLDMRAFLESERIVGDLAFVAIRSDGIPVPLRDAQGREWLFYSAVRPSVLSTMTQDKHKSVILVARHEATKNKKNAIHASVSGGYASQLVTDEETAKGLLRM